MNASIRTLIFIAIIVLAGSLQAQSTSPTLARPAVARPVPTPVFDGEWSFARLAYSGYSYRGNSYLTDYDDAEYFLRAGLDRLTRLHSGAPVIVSPDDPNLMNYPWLYGVEVGNWYLDDVDAEHLREYLLRGGFLMVDDFHGTEEWLIFETSMKRVFPTRPIVDIPETDPLMKIVYEVDKSIQIPGIVVVNSGRTYEGDGYTPQWLGIYDDDGRLMVAINHNMDLGDSWEHADDPRYPEPMTNLGIRYAVNYVIYSMTH